MGQLFLHIGTMKSATTYLQNLLDVNRVALSGVGVHWPGSHEAFAASRLDKGAHPTTWAPFVHEVERQPGIGLISNELLAMRGSRHVRRLLRPMGSDTTVILTARDLARVIPSQWHTGTRGRGLVPPWATFADALARDDSDAASVAWFWRRHDLPRIVERWAAELSLESIRLVTVPPQGSAPELIGQRFLSVLGVDASALAAPTWTSPTDGMVTSELMRRLSFELTDLSDARYREVVTDLLGGALLASPRAPEPAARLTAGQLAWTQDRAEAMVEALRGLGVTVVGDLDDLIPSPDTATSEDTYEPSADDLLAVATRAIKALSAAWPRPDSES